VLEDTPNSLEFECSCPGSPIRLGHHQSSRCVTRRWSCDRRRASIRLFALLCGGYSLASVALGASSVVLAKALPNLPMISRRIFIAAGIAGAAALVTARWLQSPHSRATAASRRALDADGEAIMRAIVPVLLAGALPIAAEERITAIAETLTHIDAAIAGLPPVAQTELAQLFALLALPPARIAFAGLTTTWREADADALRAFLDGFRASSWTLKRAAYDALHQLVFAAWYGNPRAWGATGYDGPPRLSA